MAQISPINGFLVRDFYGDGNLDVYCAGNNYGPEPSTGRFDGGVSLLLKGDGHGGLAPVPTWQSGLLAAGDARAVVAVDLPGARGAPTIAVSQCNGPVLLFSRNPHAGQAAEKIASR
jgi:hypothetical protein